MTVIYATQVEVYNPLDDGIDIKAFKERISRDPSKETGVWAELLDKLAESQVAQGLNFHEYLYGKEGYEGYFSVNPEIDTVVVVNGKIVREFPEKPSETTLENLAKKFCGIPIPYRTNGRSSQTVNIENIL